MKTPIVIVIFNRPYHTQRVLESLRPIKPETIFVVSDGPRDSIIQDQNNCAEARRLFEKIDWKCDLIKKYSDVNLGCFKNVSLGLDWAFSQTEEAIILEDDCIADPSFFQYCEVLLEKYKQEPKIGVISGNNFQNGHLRGDSSYYYSIFNHLWGWATWKRAWELFDPLMNDWISGKDHVWFKKLWSHYPKGENYWRKCFDQVSQNKIDSWGYRWTYSCWKNNLLTTIPQTNLVTNIGFGPQSTHTKNKYDISANLRTKSIKLPLEHPLLIEKNKEADIYTQKTIFSSSLFQRVSQRLIKLFKANQN